MKDGDFVLDNLNEDIQSVVAASRHYRWLRIQSPQNPKFWTRVGERDVKAISSRFGNSLPTVAFYAFFGRRRRVGYIRRNNKETQDL